VSAVSLLGKFSLRPLIVVDGGFVIT